MPAGRNQVSGGHSKDGQGLKLAVVSQEKKNHAYYRLPTNIIPEKAI
jgi:hypothetical protein